MILDILRCLCLHRLLNRLNVCQNCLLLITASILSKKLAEGLDALVMDVKFGRAAFMQDREAAEALAQSIMALAEECGVTCRAVLSDMNTPLGRAAGNWLEVKEAIDCLEGRGPSDLEMLTVSLAANLPGIDSERALAELARRREEDPEFAAKFDADLTHARSADGASRGARPTAASAAASGGRGSRAARGEHVALRVRPVRREPLLAELLRVRHRAAEAEARYRSFRNRLHADAHLVHRPARP